MRSPFLASKSTRDVEECSSRFQRQYARSGWKYKKLVGLLRNATFGYVVLCLVCEGGDTYAFLTDSRIAVSLER